jgi:ribonuclease P protein component
MLPRRLRLTRQAFGEMRGLRRVQSPHFSISVGEAALGGAAVVVSKKIAKSAVSRHLLKRRVMAVIRPYVEAHHTLVVYAREGANELPYPVLKDELISLVRSILPTP